MDTVDWHSVGNNTSAGVRVTNVIPPPKKGVILDRYTVWGMMQESQLTCILKGKEDVIS